MTRPQAGSFQRCTKLVVAVLVPLLLFACGGSSEPTEGGPPESGSAATTPSSDRTWAGTDPAYEFPEGLAWFNVDQPLTLESLRGKMVVLDFWTQGCINCHHIVPDLQRLEQEFAETLVVVGVHSGKYATEQEDESIREAIARLNLEHPVVNDDDFVFWERYAIRAWPTTVVIDPAGNIVGYHEGEGVYQVLQPILASLEQEFSGKLDRTPAPVALDAVSVSTVLRYPGALATDEENGRLYIADSGHDRVLVSNLTGDLQRAIGSGEAGFADGDAGEARFRQPHGLAVSEDGSTLYIADTRNHAIRAVDTGTWEVRTIAGTGNRLSMFPQPGADPIEVDLASPWGLTVVGQKLYIGMAGVHQIWVMDLEANSIEVFAGTSREGLDDGERLHMATLAQPSGLTHDEGFLYWVDPEASAARRVGYGSESLVDTLVGTGLFDYGNEDGSPGEGQLQHPQDIVYLNGTLYIADTYNHAIRALDPGTRELTTIAGSGERAWTDGPGREAQFDEPGGIAAANGLLYVADTNNHLIRVIEPAGGMVSTMQLANIGAIGPGGAGRPVITELQTQEVAPGMANIRFRISAPPGYQLNSLAPSRLTLHSSNNAVIELGEPEIAWSSDEGVVDVPVPVSLSEGQGTVTASGEAYYCETGATELCFITRIEITAPVHVRPGAPGGEVVVAYELPPG